MVTECHQLHFTVSTLIHCVQCTKPHPPLHILSSPAAYIGLCYFLVCSQLLILIYRVQHCSSLLVNIVTVLQQTLSKCEYRREENEGEEEDSNSSGCVTSLPKIPLLEEDMALVVSHLTQLQTTHKHSTNYYQHEKFC